MSREESFESHDRKIKIDLDSKLAERLFLKLSEYAERIRKYDHNFDGRMPHDFMYWAPEVKRTKPIYFEWIKWSLLNNLLEHGELKYDSSIDGGATRDFYDSAYKIIELYATGRGDEVADGSGLPKLKPN